MGSIKIFCYAKHDDTNEEFTMKLGIQIMYGTETLDVKNHKPAGFNVLSSSNSELGRLPAITNMETLKNTLQKNVSSVAIEVIHGVPIFAEPFKNIRLEYVKTESSKVVFKIHTDNRYYLAQDHRLITKIK